MRNPWISDQLVRTRFKDRLLDLELTRTKSNGPNPENEFHIEINSLKNIEMSEFTVTKYSVLSKPVLIKYQSSNLVYTVSYRTYFGTAIQRLPCCNSPYTLWCSYGESMDGCYGARIPGVYQTGGQNFKIFILMHLSTYEVTNLFIS